MNKISEPDWKLLRELKPVALERLRALIAQGLITDEELLRFSPELRSRPLRSRS